MKKKKLHGKLYGTDSKLVEEFRWHKWEKENVEKEVTGFPHREKSVMKPMSLEPQDENLLHMLSD